MTTLASVRRIIISAGLLTAACGGNSSPTAPSNTTNTPPPPAVTVSSVNVNGGANCNNGSTCSAPANSLQLTAIATLSNGSTQTVTTQAQWRSTNATVADVSSTGVVSPHNPGATDVTAVYQGVLGGVTIVVPAAWSRSGTGDTVFDMPTYISRVQVTGRYTSYTSNFIVYVGGRLLVNELLGTGWNQVEFSGTYVTTGGTVEIRSASGVQWTFTQVRP